MRVHATYSLLWLAIAACFGPALQAGAQTPITATPEQSITAFPPEYFAASAPANALEMVQRLPGFVIVEAAERLVDLLPMLRNIKKHADAIGLLAREIGRIEERSDELHDQGVKELFKVHRGSDTMAYIVGADIYDHLEKVVDRFEDVAKRVSRIVLEHL